MPVDVLVVAICLTGLRHILESLSHSAKAKMASISPRTKSKAISQFQAIIMNIKTAGLCGVTGGNASCALLVQYQCQNVCRKSMTNER